MATLYVMEAVNLFCGDSPDDGKHLSIDELKLPDLEENYAEHKPGGGRVNIDIPVGINKLEAPFKLKGWDPQVMSLFGLGQKVTHQYTALGALIDKRTGRSIQAKSIMEGRMGKIAPDAFQRGEFQGFDYMIAGIMHYELYFDGVEKFYWDFYTNALRVDGEDQNADLNARLNISG